MTTQLPFEVWLADLPKMDYPPLRLVRFSGLALTEGNKAYDQRQDLTLCQNLPRGQYGMALFGKFGMNRRHRLVRSQIWSKMRSRRRIPFRHACQAHAVVTLRIASFHASESVRV